MTPKVQDFQNVYHPIEVMVCSNKHDMAECVRPTSPDGRERIPESVVGLVRFRHVQQQQLPAMWLCSFKFLNGWNFWNNGQPE